jgi:hypothetical protein
MRPADAWSIGTSGLPLRLDPTQNQSWLAILVPNVSAEKRTSAQPTGKRTSVTPRDTRPTVATPGPDATKRATMIPPKIEPTANPTAMWAAAPPHGR